MVLVGFSSDLHYPGEEYYRILSMIGGASPDILVLGGDLVDYANPNLVYKLLRVLDRHAPNRVVAVLGNHEHYLSKKKASNRKTDSLKEAMRVAGILEQAGVRVLDLSPSPVVLLGVHFAGCVGWYDYTLAPPGYSLEDFERCNPFGVPLRDLELCANKRLTYLCPPWWRNDCLRIRLPFTHSEYVARCRRHVEMQMRVAGRPLILVYHHVPRRDIPLYTGGERDFDLAYAGSTLLDEPVRAYRPDLVVYGHLHGRSRARHQTLEGTPYLDAYPLRTDSPGLPMARVRGPRVEILAGETLSG